MPLSYSVFSVTGYVMHTLMIHFFLLMIQFCDACIPFRCDLDQLPLLKECPTVLLPVIIKIVNLLLHISTMSENMKEALLLPY